MATNVVLPRLAMAAHAERVSPEITILDSDGRVIVAWDVVDATRQNGAWWSAATLEASPDDWQTTVLWGRMTTSGTPARTDFSIPPHFFVPAPPAGWKVRARLTAGATAMTAGLLVRSVTEIRWINAPGTHHSVAKDTGAYIGGTAGTTLQVNLTLAGSDRCLIANVTDSQDGASLQSVSGAGATWASLGQATQNRAAYQWKGVAPSTGSQTVTATWDNSSGSEELLMVTAFTGVDQTTPTSDTTTNTGTDAGPTVTVPNVTTGDYVIDCVAAGSLDTVDPYGVGAGQTAEYVEESTDARGGSSIQPGSAGGVMSWTMTEGGNWAIIATRLRQAAGGGTDTLSVSLAEPLLGSASF